MSTETFTPLACEHCSTTENISWAAGVARILCPDCYQRATTCRECGERFDPTDEVESFATCPQCVRDAYALYAE
jgi:hypothetical protein